MSTDGPAVESQRKFFSERKGAPEIFDTMTYFSPLEHSLIGSSVDIKDQTSGKTITFNADSLANNENIRKHPDLLKPLGLINGKLDQESIRNERKKKGTLSKNFSCFKPLGDKDMRKKFGFDYQLGVPDGDGKIPNSFVFQFRLKDGSSYDGANTDHAKALDQVELTDSMKTYGEDKKPLFSMNKESKTGRISLVFMPLEDKDFSQADESFLEKAA